MGFYLQSHRELSQVTTWQDPSLGIMKWGLSNSYPQTLINFIAQSSNASPAVERTADFLKGQGFKGEDVIVTPTGLTAKQVVDIMCDDYAYFRAFALHGNYNLEGEVSSIIPMRISTLRFNEFDELNYASKVGYHPNFGLNSVEQKLVRKLPNRGNIKWFNRFNPSPEVVLAQIKNDANGVLGNYNGQILYYSKAGHSAYPIPPLQAAINYVLSDIDNSILVRKETATGFVNSYLLKTSMEADSPVLFRLEEEIARSQGARGSGRVITMSGLSDEEMRGNVLEPIGQGGSGKKNTIESAILTYELDKRVIDGAYLIPPVLSGGEQNNGLTGIDLQDAYDVFNAITQPARDIIEQQFNRMLSHSVFKDKIPPIKIKPLSLNTEAQQAQERTQQEIEIEEETPINRNPMTGRETQSLQRIVRNYNKGNLTREQAEDQLRNDLGFDDARVEAWIGKNEENV